jgi:hypothetical protein
MTRIDELTSPPVPGQYYLVPVVNGLWRSHINGYWISRMGWWPVMGELHEDTKFFHFTDQHYHLDRRFLKAERDAEQAVTCPLSERPPFGVTLSAPKWSRRKCYRPAMGFPIYEKPVDAIPCQHCPVPTACVKSGRCAASDRGGPP